jgi:hypothetical protein
MNKLYVVNVVEVSVSAATTQTLLQVVAADANTPLRIKRWSVSFKDATSTDTPVKVEILRQSTAGTSSSLTPLSWRENESSSARFTALQTFTAEPTAGNILVSNDIEPYGGIVIESFLDGEEIVTTTRLGLRVVTQTSQAQTVSASLLIAE